jgi:hypothetical protein
MKILNEFGILMHLLSRSRMTSDAKNPILQYGCHSDELCKELKFTGKTAIIQLTQLLASFSHAIHLIGLQIRQNPFNHYWYVTQDTDIQNYFLNNPFENKIRLGATLSVIISLCLVHGGKIDHVTLQNTRKKKDLSEDLKELETQGFIVVSKNQIELSPNLGYYLNLDLFLKNIDKKKTLQKSVASPKPSSSQPD